MEVLRKIMTWQKTDTDEQLIKDGLLLARIYWIGNMYACDIFPPGKPKFTITEARAEQAKAWAEAAIA